MDSSETPTNALTLSTSGTLPATHYRIIGKDYMVADRESPIGRGSFATVYRGHHQHTGHPVAVKTIHRSRLTPKLVDALESEIAILQNIRHANVVRLLDMTRTPRHVYLVLEYCAGGDMAAYLRKTKILSESVARHFLRQLASALEAMQVYHLVHRDIKPSNLLLTSESDDAILKVADFGFARTIQPMDMAETLCGSPLYMAPEILRYEKYDAKADLWSVGAVLFEWVTGRPPFRAANHIQLLRQIETTPRIRFPTRLVVTNTQSTPTTTEYPINLSESCRDLLTRLLRRLPLERCNFDEFFHHPFLRDNTGLGSNASSTISASSAITTIANNTSNSLGNGSQMNSLSRRPSMDNQDMQRPRGHSQSSDDADGVGTIAPGISITNLQQQQQPPLYPFPSSLPVTTRAPPALQLPLRSSTTAAPLTVQRGFQPIPGLNASVTATTTAVATSVPSNPPSPRLSQRRRATWQHNREEFVMVDRAHSSSLLRTRAATLDSAVTRHKDDHKIIEREEKAEEKVDEKKEDLAPPIPPYLTGPSRLFAQRGVALMQAADLFIQSSSHNLPQSHTLHTHLRVLASVAFRTCTEVALQNDDTNIVKWSLNQFDAAMNQMEMTATGSTTSLSSTSSVSPVDIENTLFTRALLWTRHAAVDELLGEKQSALLLYNNAFSLLQYVRDVLCADNDEDVQYLDGYVARVEARLAIL